MKQVESLRNRRKEILEELSQLERIRRGSLVEQYVEATRKDGTKTRRGPYMLYSYKEKGKTVSRRLTNPEEIPVYRKQIDGFRRFQELTGELRAIGEKLCNLLVSETEVKKTSRKKSRSKKTLK